MKCKICGGRLKIWKKKLFDDRHGYPNYFDILRCVKCNFGQSSPQIPAKKISEIYAKYYPWQKTDISKIKESDFKKPNNFTIWRKGLFINGQYLVKPGSNVLDVGCGLGYSLLELKSVGCEAYGIDPDPNAAKLAKKFGLKFKRAFITDNPFPNEKFDYIIANQVLEHTNDPVRFINACKKHLNANGKIILSFPNNDSLTRLILDKKWLHWHLPYHLNFFTKPSINILASRTKLSVDNIMTVTPNMWTNLQIRRLLQKPKIGIRDTFWDGKPNTDDIKLTNGIYPRLVHLLEEYNFANRIIDLFGLGESFVLTLKNG